MKKKTSQHRERFVLAEDAARRRRLAAEQHAAEAGLLSDDDTARMLSEVLREHAGEALAGWSVQKGDVDDDGAQLWELVPKGED